MCKSRYRRNSNTLGTFSFEVSVGLYIVADADVSLGDSQRASFFRSTVNGRMAFSAALLEIEHLPPRR